MPCRMLCTEPALAVSLSADPSLPVTEPTLMDPWWDSGRPDATNDLQRQPSGMAEAVLVPLASSRRTGRSNKQHHHQKQGLLWQSFDLPPSKIPAVLLEPHRQVGSMLSHHFIFSLCVPNTAVSIPECKIHTWAYRIHTRACKIHTWAV